MRLARLLPLPIVAIVLCGACSSDSGKPPAFEVAGSPDVAAPVDTGSTDAGADVGPADAAADVLPDAPLPDGMPRDAAPTDGNVPPDSAGPDAAGPDDGGLPPDVPQVDVTGDDGAVQDLPATPDVVTEDVAPDVAPPLPLLALNEVNCHGNDWIEVVNLDPAADADISGFILTDNPDKESHYYPIPDGTTLAAGGFYVVSRQTEDSDGFTFGIGCAKDTVYLLAPDTTTMDQVAPPLYPEGNTWGRIPDGSGPWVETIATPEAPNVVAPDLSVVLFDPFLMAEIDITLPDSSYQSLWNNPYVLVPAQFKFSSPQIQQDTIDVGIKIKGKWGSYRQLDKKSAFRINFPFSVPGQTFIGLENLTLNNMVQDPSMIHETLNYTIFRAFGVPTPRTGYAWVRVNGEVYGLYLLIERYDDIFMSKTFQSTQHMYEGSYGVDILPESVGAFEVHEGSETKRQDLQKLATVGVDTPDETWWTAMNLVADMTELVKMWAVEQFIGHWDGYAPTINNYFLHSDDDGYFHMLPWGTDQTFSDWRNYYQGNGMLFKRCMNVAKCRSEYELSLLQLSQLLPSLDLDTLAQDVSTYIAPWADADPRKPYPSEGIPDQVTGTRNFIKGRTEQLADIVACLTGPSKPDKDQDGFLCVSDCNDEDPTVHAGATEVCGDGIDQDCNGKPDDGWDCPDCVELWRGNHRYLVCPIPRNYEQAVQHCKDYQSEIIIINSKAENDFIRSTIQAWGTGDVWIGLTDILEEGTFIWWDGTAPTFTAWNGGEPNDWGGEDCGQLMAWAGWNDLPCEAQLPVVCEDVCAPGQDADKDGFSPCVDDCDDSNPLVKPDAPEICGNGIDDDCSGVADDAPSCNLPTKLPLNPPVQGADFYFQYKTTDNPSARATCQATGSGGDLAWFDSLAQQQVVVAAVNAMAPGTEAWFGLNDQAEEGNYVWFTGGKPSYLNWAQGQPNNADGGQNCARMLANGAWNDTKCELQYGFVCRVPVKP